MVAMVRNASRRRSEGIMGTAIHTMVAGDGTVEDRPVK